MAAGVKNLGGSSEGKETPMRELTSSLARSIICCVLRRVGMWKNEQRNRRIRNVLER